MKSDVELGLKAKLRPIEDIAKAIGIKEGDLLLFGKYKAKISFKLLEEVKGKPDGKLVLVTAMTPTKAGEGKTTTTIGLSQALARLKKKAMVCIREPSMGPVFGIKGGAAGGGYSQVLPMQDINLQFTGDIPAVTAAHNLLSAMIDNHIFQGNQLMIDHRRIIWHRVVDMNDRALRKVFIGIGDKSTPREDGFDITAASEVMAVLCLAESVKDLKERLGKIVVGYNMFGKPVTAKDLKAEGAMAAILVEAFNPNLVQTTEGVPAFVHGGPFANIAHGASSLIATKTALKLSDIVVTEAGFGADLGAEKFFDIVCRQGNLKPDCVVLVATIRALRLHGGAADYTKPDVKAVDTGFENLEKQIENIRKFNLPLVVALNKFGSDTDGEIKLVLGKCSSIGVGVALSEVYAKGGEGGIDLARKVVELLFQQSNFKPLYGSQEPLKRKIEKIATEIYGANGVLYTEFAEHDIKQLEGLGFKDLPVCVSKTQMSLSDDKNLIGRPRNFKITVREVRVSAGAGFYVVLTGDVVTMPGLPKNPAAENIDVTDEGEIVGLF